MLDDDNGFRSHILPFAVNCPLVRRAVCVTAAFHLSLKITTLRADAEAGRGIILKLLQDIALTDRDHQKVFAESSWCCLILLILGDLITGSADIMALRKTLVSFREGRKREGMGKGPLIDFLEYQSGLYENPPSFLLLFLSAFPHGIVSLTLNVLAFCRIEFVARPMSKIPGRDACETFQLDHKKYNFSPAIQTIIAHYNRCFQTARRVYHLRLQQSTLTLEEAAELSQTIQDLKSTLVYIDAKVPGSHRPLWPCFVAGCESNNLLERNYFYARLETIWLRTWSRNPFAAMKGLQYMWSLGPGVNWAEKLEELDSGRDNLLKS